MSLLLTPGKQPAVQQHTACNMLNAGVVHNGKFYLSGTTIPQLPQDLQDDVRILDLTSLEWMRVVTPVKPRGCEGPFIVGHKDQLIQFGGVHDAVCSTNYHCSLQKHAYVPVQCLLRSSPPCQLKQFIWRLLTTALHSHIVKCVISAL